MAPVRSTTTLRRWDPLQEFDALQAQLGQLFGPTWVTARPAPARSTGWRPTADVARTDAGYTVRIDVPGAARDDLTIEVEDQVLRVTGEVPGPGDGEQRSGTRRYGRFDYRATLPTDAELGAIGAELADGVLTVTIPRAEAAKPRRISLS